MRCPYDLRHSGVTWRLNSGVPPTEIAAWAGHSVEMLLRVYARCVAGLEDLWISRMESTLRPPDPERGSGGQVSGGTANRSGTGKPMTPRTKNAERNPDDTEFGSIFEVTLAPAGPLCQGTHRAQAPAQGGFR